MTREPIFDSFTRADAGPSEYAEETFVFFNRVAGDFWDQTRSLVEEWADSIGDDNDYLQGDAL